MLTEKIIRDAKPREKRYIIWDRSIKGLGLRVFVTGHKSFVLSYRPHGGGRNVGKRLAKLGTPAELSLRDARTLATQELLAARMHKPHILERRINARRVPTVGDAFRLYMDNHLKPRVASREIKARTLQSYEYIARNQILSHLGNVRLNTISATDIETIFAPMTPPTRNRARTVLSLIYQHAQKSELIPPDFNPCRFVRTLP